MAARVLLSDLIASTSLSVSFLLCLPFFTMSALLSNSVPKNIGRSHRLKMARINTTLNFAQVVKPKSILNLSSKQFINVAVS